jgi:hypothetical protein
MAKYFFNGEYLFDAFTSPDVVGVHTAIKAGKFSLSGN